MRLLTAVDQLFLFLESRKQPMHVGGLFVFEVPDAADSDFVYQLVKQMQDSSVPPTFPFDQVLEHLVFWNKDKNFDVEHHLHHVALPKPARIRELLMYVSREHGRLLDRAMPLWECHVIEGINPENEGDPERFALYFKIHHSLVDGVAAMRLVQKSLSQSPLEPVTLPIWSLMARHRNHANTILPSRRSIRRIVKEQVSTIKPVFTELLDNFKNSGDEGYVGTFDAPMSILNKRISASRRIAAQSYDIQRFNDIAQRLQISKNDVVLAVCAGALRRYLISMDALPSKPLIAFVPMSLRTDNSISGNQVSFVLANLGTHVNDPLRRIELIHRSMNNSKRRFRRMNQAQVINYSVIAYAWEGINLATGLFPKKQAFNLIISNVAGSKKPLYWNGARLQSLYPASIVFDGQAMNITLASYLDKIEFGIAACSKALPHVQDMLELIEKELTLLEITSKKLEFQGITVKDNKTIKKLAP
ncbi:MAG: WS/DGAT/MGAT family O-acyltransferase [Psychrobacter sp.]|uniref:WS/DGAT/MGAT family O-acyltransferase n=1 Tax=unclassified Psychrobacter TaxID=196806 RepID=UPI0017885AAF|nr:MULTISPECIES: wax ester/triacylglycerol synthase family O-acyltransferase [unclassified Psychrobacter]MBE0440674.1 wax ester/triacylglycerol synthase family O-acyltransferase [Psychrobacter sp. FME13]